MADTSIERFRRVVEAAYGHLEERRQEVNDLNVFPVADGDTGDNMALTMRAVMSELDRLDGQPIDDAGPRDDRPRRRPRRADGRARQLRRDPEPDRPRRRRGAGEPPGRAGRPGAGRGGARERRRRRLRVGARPRRGNDADRDPRDGARGLAAPRAHGPPAAVRRGRATPSRTRCWPRCSRWPSQAGQEAVERTPEQLDVLAEAGVVDAGAHGLVVILAGIVAGLRGELDAIPEVAHHEPPGRRAPITSTAASATARTSSSPAGTRLARLRRRLEELGDSVLVVGDPATLKVHVHTDEPEAPSARVRGRRRRAAARRRRHARADRRPRTPAWRPARTGVVAVAAGDGHASRCSRDSARTWSTAARPSTRPPTRSSPGSTRCPPRRCSCCPTRRT